MNEIMLRGFIEKCAENRINPNVMLKYAKMPGYLRNFTVPSHPGVNVGQMDKILGLGKHSPLQAIGRSTAAFFAKMYRPRVPHVSQIAENLPIESAEGMIGQVPNVMRVRNSFLSRMLSGKATKPTMIGATALGAGSMAPSLGTMAGNATVPPPVPATPQPYGPPVPKGAPDQGGMLQQLLAAAKAKPGMAAGIGAGALGTAGAGAAGASYLKGKSKKKKPEGKSDKKEDKGSKPETKEDKSEE